MASIFYFGVDDTSASLWLPIYGVTTQVPTCLGDGTLFANVLDFDITQMFWLTNMIANLAYTRYNLIGPEIRQKNKINYINIINN